MNVEKRAPDHALVATTLLAAATGARSMSGLAALARVRASNEGGDGTSRIATIVSSMAVAEFAGDKLPGIPDRTDAIPLLGRVAVGAFVGSTIGGMTGRDRVTAALWGGLTALVAAELSFRFRRELSQRMSPSLAAVVEDVAVVAIAAAGARALTPP